MRSANRRCATCFLRWAQADGLCRTCGRALDHLTTFEREAARLARQAATHMVPAEQLAPREPLTKVVDGVEYEVAWDGS
jgi:predicted amidophosphoribosyltransferase